MKRIFALPFFVIVALGADVSQISVEKQTKIRESVERREYAVAIDELQKLRAANEDSFVENDYDYLLGRMAESNGDLAAAMSNYEAVVKRNSPLNAYALRHLAQIARSTGNLLLERIYLNEITVLSTDSLLANSAVLRLARNGFESGTYAETIRILTSRSQRGSGVGKSSKKTDIRDIKALLAEAYLRSGELDRARQMFVDLLDRVPNPDQPDDISLTAVRGLDLLDVGDQEFGKKAPALTESEHIRRANIYQFNRDFFEARLHFEAVVAGFPAGMNASDAIFQIGRGHAQQGNYGDALKWFERVLERYPESPTAKDALLQVAAAYGRVGKPKEAVTRYQTFIDKYPLDEKLDRAFLNVVDVSRDHGDDIDALKWCEKTRNHFKGKLPEAIAVFTEARIHLGKEDWPKALATLDQLAPFQNLGGSTVPGGTSDEEVTFLKGFVLERLKRYPEAVETFLSIHDGRGEYYGWLATKRLKQLAKDEIAASHIGQKIGVLSAGLKAKDPDSRRKNAQAILRLSENPDLRGRAGEELRVDIRLLPKYNLVPEFSSPNNEKLSNSDVPVGMLASRLLALGLYDEAAPEIEFSGANTTTTATRAFDLAKYYKRGDRADRGMVFIEPIWRKMPSDFPIELIPRDQAEMLYPAPYADVLLKYAPQRGVDPRLVLAIMRQESRFDPDAKSFAAARGLMQFISTTSTKVAGSLSRDNFRQDDLYSPPTAILFGSQYLADLSRNFPGQTEAVVASYNGGDDNMKRWLARARSNDPDRYVPEIVYAQTKDYVYRVMANYRMYQFLYDEQLRPRN